MGYPINKTNGDLLTTLLDGTTNTETGLTLIGRNFPNYGEFQNENFVRLLENFAATNPPGVSVGFAPLAGQLWWDTANQRLKVYNGAEFITVSEQFTGNTAPAVTKTGDQWWNNDTNQLSVYTGTGWQLIGPLYTNAQGVSGPVVSTVTDTNSNTHVIVTTYANTQPVSIFSTGPSFTPNPAITGFGNISPGINLEANAVVNGTANNSVRVGGLFANVLARTDVNNTFTKDIAVSGNLVFTDANISFVNKHLIVKNTNLGGNIDVYINSTSNGNVRALNIDGATGLVQVRANPSKNLDIATKIYVDTSVNDLTTYIDARDAQINSNVTQLRLDYIANLNAVVESTNANLNAYGTYSNARMLTTETNLTAFQVATVANAVSQQNEINVINNTLPTLAPLNSPALFGLPTVPNVTLNDRTGSIASTYYVDSSDDLLKADYNNQVTVLAAATAANLANGLALKANINSPTLTGTPAAPTPTSGDSSTKIATTAFVSSAITAAKFNYTVANTAPGVLSGVISSTNGAAGNNGDFWFQVG